MSAQLRRGIGIDLKNEGRGTEYSIHDTLELGCLAEKVGFDSVWLNEDVAKDSVALFAAMSMVTKSVEFGTAIMNVYTRSPLQIAMAAATLDELSQCRFILGLSTGHHPWCDVWHGIPLEAPLARLREYVTFIRKALSGDEFTHDGRFFTGVKGRLGFRPPRPHLPIYIGATRPRMVALAGQVADGLITNVVPSHYIENFQAEHFRQAARKAGRNPNSLAHVVLVTCCPVEDRTEALAHARSYFRYRTQRDPAKKIDILGQEFRDELLALQDLYDRGEQERALEEASEQLVTSTIAVGGRKDLWNAIERYFSAGATRVVVVSWPRGKAWVERLLHVLAGEESPR